MSHICFPYGSACCGSHPRIPFSCMIPCGTGDRKDPSGSRSHSHRKLLWHTDCVALHEWGPAFKLPERFLPTMQVQVLVCTKLGLFRTCLISVQALQRTHSSVIFQVQNVFQDQSTDLREGSILGRQTCLWSPDPWCSSHRILCWDGASLASAPWQQSISRQMLLKWMKIVIGEPALLEICAYRAYNEYLGLVLGYGS